MKTKLLFLISFLTISIASAQAVGDVFTVADINYKVTKLAPDEAEVTGSVLVNVIVPSSVTDPTYPKTYSVTQIGTGAFLNNTTIKTIELPVTVRAIATTGFQAASSLTSVTFTTTSGITSVAQRAFLNCTALNNIDGVMSNLVTMSGTGIFNNTGFTSLKTPSTLADLASTVTSAFRAINTLVTVDMSASNDVKFLPSLTFYLNPNLESVKLPSSLTTLSASVFASCPKLSSIVLPSTVTSIGSKVFENCTVLTSVQVNNTTPITITADVFSGTMVIGNATLYVPDATAKAAYEAADVWKNFGTIKVGTLSTNNPEQELGFSLYPNPTTSSVFINSKELNNANVSVYDINGRNQLSKNISGTSAEINIFDLASGVYFFKVKVDGTEFVKRVIKK